MNKCPKCGYQTGTLRTKCTAEVESISSMNQGKQCNRWAEWDKELCWQHRRERERREQ